MTAHDAWVGKQAAIYAARAAVVEAAKAWANSRGDDVMTASALLRSVEALEKLERPDA